jgi:hypothetical protein
MKAFAVVLLALTCSASAAGAADIYAKYFADADGGRVCYARYYDAAHLAAHPRQTVRRIMVDYDRRMHEDAGPENTAAKFIAGIGFMLTHSGGWYTQELFCKTAGGYFDCYLDADGGSIRLIPDRDALRLQVIGGGGGTDRIVVEGAAGFGKFGAPGSDDRAFVLPRADRKLCNPAVAR